MAYTTIDDPSAHFQALTFTGNGSNGHAITYDGNSTMQPDFLMFQNSTIGGNKLVHDSSRGSNKYVRSNTSTAETTSSTPLASFDANGFTVNSSANTNGSGNTIANWGWHANAGTTSSITDFNINSTVQVNSTAGFSIVQYTGDSSTTNSRVGHGLGNVSRKDIVMIVKNRDGIVDWAVAHPAWTSTDTNAFVPFNSTAQVVSSINNFWGDEQCGNNFFEVDDGNNARNNANGINYIAYVFKQIQGFSKFGKYTGNGNADGAFIYTGFKPAVVIVKAYSGTNQNWVAFDNARNPFNVVDILGYTSATNADGTGTDRLDFLSNGFKFRNNGAAFNGSNYLYGYMAFAENPFVTSTGIPTTAR